MAPSRTFSALQQKPYGPNLVILIFCRIPIGIRIGLNRRLKLNQLVPGVRTLSNAVQSWNDMVEAQSFDQTIVHSQLQQDQEVGLDGKKLLRIAWCVEFAGMFDSIQCLPYRQHEPKVGNFANAVYPSCGRQNP
jgi:hypothetical protein